jgi:hypothetical protein
MPVNMRILHGTPAFSVLVLGHSDSESGNVIHRSLGSRMTIQSLNGRTTSADGDITVSLRPTHTKSEQDGHNGGRREYFWCESA